MTELVKMTASIAFMSLYIGYIFVFLIILTHFNVEQCFDTKAIDF